jgi:hypothetical protein
MSLKAQVSGSINIAIVDPQEVWLLMHTLTVLQEG